MVQIVGDGSFYFGGPCSVFAVAQQYKLPILCIVLDNSGWSAVKESTLRVYPDGERQAGERVPGRARCPTSSSARSARRSAPMREKVSDPAGVPAAIARCVQEVRGGRSAIAARAGDAVVIPIRPTGASISARASRGSIRDVTANS